MSLEAVQTQEINCNKGNPDNSASDTRFESGEIQTRNDKEMNLKTEYDQIVNYEVIVENQLQENLADTHC